MVNYFSYRKLAFLVLLIISPSSFAENELNEIRGLVLDRTITLSGHAFYKRFSAHWLAANLSQPQNLVITETPSARWGNIVTINSQNTLLFRTSIRPGKQIKKNTINKAAATVSQNIINRLLARNTSQDMAAVGY